MYIIEKRCTGLNVRTFPLVSRECEINDTSVIKTILLLLHILYWVLPIIAIVPTKYLYYLYYDLNELIMNEII